VQFEAFTEMIRLIMPLPPLQLVYWLRGIRISPSHLIATLSCTTDSSANLSPSEWYKLLQRCGAVTLRFASNHVVQARLQGMYSEGEQLLVCWRFESDDERAMPSQREAQVIPSLRLSGKKYSKRF
jgi:hypothetical protein